MSSKRELRVVTKELRKLAELIWELPDNMRELRSRYEFAGVNLYPEPFSHVPDYYRYEALIEVLDALREALTNIGWNSPLSTEIEPIEELAARVNEELQNTVHLTPAGDRKARRGGA